MLTYRGGGGSAKGYKIKRFAKGYIFLKYVPICGVYREAPNEAPAGLLRGLLRGLLLHHYGGGAAAAMGTSEAKRGGRAAPRERGTGANVPKSP